MGTRITPGEIDFEDDNWRIAVDDTADELHLEHKPTGNALRVAGDGTVTIPGDVSAVDADFDTAAIRSLTATLSGALDASGNDITDVGQLSATSITSSVANQGAFHRQNLGAVTDTDRSVDFDETVSIPGDVDMVEIEYFANGVSGSEFRLQLDGDTTADYLHTQWNGTSYSGESSILSHAVGSSSAMGKVRINRAVGMNGINSPGGANRPTLYAVGSGNNMLHHGQAPPTSSIGSVRLFSSGGGAFTANVTGYGWD